MTISITGVDFITIPVRDLDAARAFYGEVLGLEPSQVYQLDGQPALGAEFETGNVTISLFAPELIGMSFTPHSMSLALHVDDIEAARATLVERGVEFHAPETMDTGVCHMAHFSDPDGNALMLHSRYAPRPPRS